MALIVKSPAFEHQHFIPKRYTCQGEDVNPPLHITALPKETKSLVLIMDDPDAPGKTWDHWIVFNIQPTGEIAENSVPQGSTQGINSWGKNAYGGPCPPSGTHRYFFKIYALNTTLKIPLSSRKKDVEAAMQGHILTQGELIGLYKKE